MLKISSDLIKVKTQSSYMPLNQVYGHLRLWFFMSSCIILAESTSAVTPCFSRSADLFRANKTASGHLTILMNEPLSWLKSSSFQEYSAPLCPYSMSSSLFVILDRKHVALRQYRNASHPIWDFAKRITVFMHTDAFKAPGK